MQTEGTAWLALPESVRAAACPLQAKLSSVEQRSRSLVAVVPQIEQKQPLSLSQEQQQQQQYSVVHHQHLQHMEHLEHLQGREVEVVALTLALNVAD